MSKYLFFMEDLGKYKSLHMYNCTLIVGYDNKLLKLLPLPTFVCRFNNYYNIVTSNNPLEYVVSMINTKYRCNYCNKNGINDNYCSCWYYICESCGDKLYKHVKDEIKRITIPKMLYIVFVLKELCLVHDIINYMMHELPSMYKLHKVSMKII